MPSLHPPLLDNVSTILFLFYVLYWDFYWLNKNNNIHFDYNLNVDKLNVNVSCAGAPGAARGIPPNSRRLSAAAAGTAAELTEPEPRVSKKQQKKNPK